MECTQHLLDLQDCLQDDKARMAYAALEAYAKAGRSQRSIDLWEQFWRPTGLGNAATAKQVLSQPCWYHKKAIASASHMSHLLILLPPECCHNCICYFWDDV